MTQATHTSPSIINLAVFRICAAGAGRIGTRIAVSLCPSDIKKMSFVRRIVSAAFVALAGAVAMGTAIGAITHFAPAYKMALTNSAHLAFYLVALSIINLEINPFL